MKKVFVVLFLFFMMILNAQILEMTSSDDIFVVLLAPNEYGVVVKENNQWILYNENLEELTSFTINEPYISVYIWGCAKDFDDDDNYEVFFWYYDDSYTYKTILRDITTNENQIDLQDNSDYYYYPKNMPFYLNNERFFTITKQSSTDFNTLETYLYRSGVQVSSNQNVIDPNSAISNTKVYPNPFMQNKKLPVKISFELAQPQSIDISIYNLKGQKVDTVLSDSAMNVGSHTVLWHPKRSISNGVYFFKINLNSGDFIKKMIIVK